MGLNTRKNTRTGKRRAAKKTERPQTLVQLDAVFDQLSDGRSVLEVCMDGITNSGAGAEVGAVHVALDLIKQAEAAMELAVMRVACEGCGPDPGVAKARRQGLRTAAKAVGP